MGDNNDIVGLAPVDYLPKCLVRLSPEEKKQMYCQCTLPEGWETMDYEEFLKGRRTLIA